MIDEIKDKIANDKEILNVLPQNTARNKIKYLDKVKELHQEYSTLVSQVYNYINVKNTLISNYKVDSRINDYNMRIAFIKDNLACFNRFLDSYEILGLDKVFYELHKYYDSDLESYNDNLAKVMDIFTMVDVHLTSADFTFNQTANLYMKTFFEERQKGNYNSDLVRKTFEELFSMEHNMMRYILLNIKHLYYKNIKKFEEYVDNKRMDILREYGNDYQKMLDTYQTLVKERDILTRNCKALYFDRFINKELSTKDFTVDKINVLKQEIFGDNRVPNYLLLENLYYAVKEYQTINEYRYIFDDINKLKKDNDNYKNIVKTTFKEIEKLEKSIESSNSKGLLSKIFHKKNDNLSKTLEDLDNAYEKLLVDKYKEDIFNLPSEANLEAYIALSASLHYLIDVKTRSKIEELDIDLALNGLKELLYSPYNSLINNISYKDIDRINFIIFDKYKLLGININIESLSPESLNVLISAIEHILISGDFERNNFNVDEVDFLILSNEIIKNRNN